VFSLLRPSISPGGTTTLRQLRPPTRPVLTFRFPIFVSRLNSLLRLLRPFDETVKLLVFSNQLGRVTAVRLVAPSRRNR